MTHTEIAAPWRNYKVRDSLHSLCSYLGSFPPELARFFIQNFSLEGDLVFDPFSGRGTTLLESRYLNRKVIASDLNPIALALSRAKAAHIEEVAVLKRIEELAVNYDYAMWLPETEEESEDIKLIYHVRTLAELCYLKEVLIGKGENIIDDFILGCLLGIMHGSIKKDGTSSYLSISMPNTFSMAPDYVRRFVQKNQLDRKYHSTFESLKSKTKRVFSTHKSPTRRGKVYECDAKQISKHKNLKLRKGKVDLVLTSPPYLGVVNYAKQNWIRSWLLDADPKTISNKLDDDLNLVEWKHFAKLFIYQAKYILKKEGIFVCVIGDVVKSKDTTLSLGREIVNIINGAKIFENIWVYNDRINKDSKTTKIWGKTKGMATSTDRIIIASNINPFDKFPHLADLEFGEQELNTHTRNYL